MNRIAVTGLGVISALGSNLEENLSALRAAHCGLSHLELFNTKYASLLRFGEIKTETKTFKEKLNSRETGITRTSLLALHALEEALIQSELTSKQIASEDTALVIGNTVGGMCLTDELFLDANRAEGGSDYLSSYDCGSVTLYLREKKNIRGVCNTINTACSSSANAIMYGARLIQHGFAKRAIVGGVDSLAKFTINGFNSLGILSPENCRPFDKDRRGLNLGEGAGIIVLERESDVPPKKMIAFLSGFENTNDAFHPSSLSPEGVGPQAAMRGALKRAGIPASHIGYINTHGTGTENNDEVEGKAMRAVFDKVPPFTTSKSKIGHTLGAAAAIESVFSLLALQHGEIFPGLGFQSPIESTGLSPIDAWRKQELQHVMSNSFGFGGNCASLIFSKI